MQAQEHPQHSSLGLATTQRTASSAVDKFEAIHQCANALFEQQTRCLTRTAEMNETVLALNTREKELQHRHRALQQLAAQLDAEVTISTQRNSERKAALAEVEQSVQCVHTHHVQLQRAAQRADGVAHLVGEFVTSEVGDASNAIPTFLATASEVLCGATAAELRQTTNELRRLQARSGQLSQDVRAAMSTAAVASGDDAAALADNGGGGVVAEMAESFATFAHGWAARHSGTNAPQAVRRQLQSERGGGGSLLQLLESFRCGNAAAAAPPSAAGLIVLDALLRSPRLECSEWQAQCSASFEQLGVCLGELYQNDQSDLPEMSLAAIVREAKARGLSLPHVLCDFLHRTHRSDDVPDSQTIAAAPITWPLSDVLQRMASLDAERQRVHQMEAERHSLADALEALKQTALTAGVALNAEKALHKNATDLCHQKELLLQEAKERVAAATAAQTACTEETRHLSQAHDETLRAEDATIERALAELHNLWLSSCDDWGVARALDWEFSTIQEEQRTLLSGLTGIEAELDRAKSACEQATQANAMLTTVAQRFLAAADDTVQDGATPAPEHVPRPFDASDATVLVPPQVSTRIAQVLRSNAIDGVGAAAGLQDASAASLLEQSRRVIQQHWGTTSALEREVSVLQTECDAMRRENVRLTESLAAMTA